MEDVNECPNFGTKRREEYCCKVAQEPHLCPYQSEINDDYETLCTCCDGCENECAMDI